MAFLSFSSGWSLTTTTNKRKGPWSLLLKGPPYPKMDQKVCLNLVINFKINCVLLHSWREKKFWGFYSKWLLWQPVTAFGGFTLIALMPTIPAFFTKQDLIFKQAYLVGPCFDVFNKLKFWQLVLVFSALYRLYLEITLFCSKPSEQIVCCHVTDVKRLKKLVYWITTLLVFDYPKFQEFIFNTLQSRMLVQSQLVQR